MRNDLPEGAAMRADWNLGRRDLVRALAAAPLAMAVMRGLAPSPARAGPLADADPGLRAAFYYGYPLYEFAHTEQGLTDAIGQPGRINLVKRRSKLIDANDRYVTAPNNDTIYCSVFLDLSSGPIEMVSPTEHDRYFSIALMDAFTDVFAYVGTRATGGMGGRFWIAGPQWRGAVPAGVRLLRASTNDAWILVRILVDGVDDLPAAIAVQDQFRIIVPEGHPPARGFTTKAVAEVRDPANFLAMVNEMIRRSPGGRGQLARAGRFTRWGIGTDRPPSDALLRQWEALLPDGVADLKAGFLFRDLVVDSWSYQPRGVGDFGTNDRLRAMIALGGLAANTEQEAMYFNCSFDARGERLSGEHAYRWHVPPGGVPAKAFWSLTMYEALPDGRYFLTQNPIDRYSIGNRTRDLVYEPDGSLIIPMQHARPEGRLAANWLPAPAGPMRLAVRAYIPEQVLIDRKWRLPPVVRA